ncbi:YihE protein, a ser/thr kinase implicated in LPS synthesis and Cpx signalling [Raoultella ornithinolytica]|nr:YihE protein, a ser/thr kinase implicated in LPS synthesis and Cpx signalling [Raoultella ornithinolytica]
MSICSRRGTFLNTQRRSPQLWKKDFLRAADKLIAAVIAQWHGNADILRLHGDCHAGNILWRDGPLLSI